MHYDNLEAPRFLAEESSLTTTANFRSSCLLIMSFSFNFSGDDITHEEGGDNQPTVNTIRGAELARDANKTALQSLPARVHDLGKLVSQHRSLDLFHYSVVFLLVKVLVSSEHYSPTLELLYQTLCA